MQVFLKSIMILFIISNISCDRDNFQSDYSNGKASALMNGDHWIGQGRGIVNRKGIGLDMYYDVFDNKGQLRQRLSFRKIPSIKGVYNLYDTSGQSRDSLVGCGYATVTSDGDVVEDVYRVVDIENQSTIEVMDYNDSNRILRGHFSVKLSIDPDRPKSNPSNPDTIQFVMGEFEVKIEG